jgi:ABC-type lipoprotein export system ATPase subunit
VELSVEHVDKSYRASSGVVSAVRGVDLKLGGGEFVAVCGPSGCGKSTLLMVAGGLLQPDRGRVVAAGRDLYQMSAAERAGFRGRTFGFVFQQFHLVPYLSVWDNVMAARLGVSEEESAASVKQRTGEILERLDLMGRSTHRPSQLSAGEKQRAALARALLNRPQVLLADEPTGNLDRAHAEQVMGYLAHFAAEGGIVVLVTHDAWAASLAQRVLRMDAGVLKSSADPRA